MSGYQEETYISAVIYAHNCQDVIVRKLGKIESELKNHFKNYEIIIVNNNSTDDTISKIKGSGAKVTVIDLAGKHSLEHAMKAGVDLSIGDFVLEIDNLHDDFPYDMIHKLYLEAVKGYDMVSAVPSCKPHLFSKLFYKIFEKIANNKLSLRTETMRIITRRLINAASRIRDKIRYRKVIYRYAGYKYSSLEYKSKHKIQTQLKFMEKLNLASQVIFFYTDIGIRLNIYISLLFMLFSVMIGGYAAYEYLTYNQIVEGWTTIMIFLSMAFSGLFMVLGILCKYLSMIMGEISTMPLYTIRSVEKE